MEAIGGKRGAQSLAPILSNFKEVERAMHEMEGAAGSADKEMGIIRDSLEFKINALKQTWVGTLQEITDRGDIGKFIDVLTKISEGLGGIISNLGILKTALIGVGTVIGSQKLGLLNYSKTNGFGGIIGNAIKGKTTNKILSNQDNVDFLKDAQSMFDKKGQYIGTDASETIEENAKLYKELDDNVKNYVKDVAEGNVKLKEGQTLLQGYKTQNSVFGKLGESLKNIGGQFLSTIVNGAVSYAASTVLMTAISGIQAYIESEERMAQKAQEITGKFKEQSTQITDYSKRIIELRTVLDDETSSTEEVKSATSELYSIQNDLISQYGAYHDGIDLVNGDLESQLKTLREINRENAQRTINEINDTKTNKVKGRNFLYGLGEGIIATTLSPGLGTGMYASKFGANYFGKNQEAKQALNNTLFESDFFGRDFGTEKYKSTTDQIKKMVNTYEGEITTANKQILQLARNFDKAFEVKGNRITFVGDIYEIEDAVTKLQLQLESLGVTDEDVFNQLSQAASGTREVIQQVGDSYLSLIEAEVQTNGQLAKYRRDLGDVYNDYIAAQTAGDTDKVAELAQQYKEIFNTIAESGIGDEYLSYFENLYPELDAIISQWKFEVEILPKIKAHHNLEDFISGSNADKLKSLYGYYIASGGAGGKTNPLMKGYWKTLEEAMADSGFTEMGSYIDYLKSRPEYSDGMNIIKQRMGSQWKDEFEEEFAKYDLTAAIDIEPKPNGMEYTKEEIEKYLSPVEVEADVKVSASEAVDSMNDAKTAITSLNDLWQQTVQDNVKVGRDKKYTDEFGNIIKQTDTSNQAIGYADPAMLTSVRSAFDKFSQDLEKKGDKQGADTINQSLKNFEETLVEFPGDAEKAQGAIDDLITSYIDQTDIIKNLTEANAEWSIAQLEAYGIENAEAVVMSRLSKRTKELAASYSKLRDVVQQYNSAMAAGDTEGQEEGISNITNQLNDMYGFIDHNGKNFQPFDEKYVSQNMDMINEAVNDTSGKFNELDRYASKKYVADLIIDTDDSDLQNAYGQLWQFLDTFDGESIDIGSSMDGTPIYATLEQIRQALNVSATEWQEILSSMTGGTITADVKYKEVKLALPTFSYADWKSQGGGEITPRNVGKYLRTSVQVPEMSYKYSGKGTKAHYGGAPGGGSGGSGGGGGGGGDSSKNKDKINEDTKQSFDWIEVRLKRLQEEVQRLDKVVTNTFEGWTKRNTALADEIAKVTEQMETQKHAAKRYLANANKIGGTKPKASDYAKGKKDKEYKKALKKYNNETNKPKASDYENGKKDKQYKYDLKQWKKAQEKWATGDYQKKIREGKIGKGDIEKIKNKYLVEYINEYTEEYQKYVDETDNAEDSRLKTLELEKQKLDNIIEQWEEIIKLTEQSAEVLDEYVNRTESLGFFVNTEDMKKQAALIKKQRDQTKSELDAAIARFNDLVKRGILIEGTQAYSEAQEQVFNIFKRYEEQNTKYMEQEKKIREDTWQKFDYLQERLDAIVKESEYVQKVLQSEKMMDDAGNLNNRGYANMAMIGVQFDEALRKMADYKKEIEDFKEVMDWNNKDDVKHLEELTEGFQGATDSMLAAKDSAKSFYEEIINAHLSKLKELMDEYKQTLSAAKDLYDFQKNISNQTKNIENLRKQLTAYQGDDSEAARKRRQELTNQLTQAEQQLQETEWDRYINQTGEMLDDLYEDYEENLNARLDNIDGLMQELIRKVNANKVPVKNGLVEVHDKYGLVYNSLDKFIKDQGSNLLTGLENGTLGEGITTISNVVSDIEDTVKKMFDNFETTRKVLTDSFDYIINKDGTVTIRFKDDARATNEEIAKAAGISVSAYEDAQKKVAEERGTKLINATTIDSTPNTPNGIFVDSAEIEKQKKEAEEAAKKEEAANVRKRISEINARLAVLKTKNDIPSQNEIKTLQAELGSLQNKLNTTLKGYATGISRVPSNQLAWTQEKGSELIFRRSDGAMLTPLGSGDMVFTNSMSRTLWELAKEYEHLKIATGSVPDIKSNVATTINQNNQIEITLPNVNDYASFKYELQNDIKFEKFIQEITLGQAMGNNTLNKRKY